VTKYRDHEQFAGGEFPIMACKDIGLATYGKNNESIEDEDIVVWYNMYYSHHPSTEDHPFVPAKFFSLKLYPENFFETNPGLLLNTKIN
jgi:primary-amine oxidase